MIIRAALSLRRNATFFGCAALASFLPTFAHADLAKTGWDLRQTGYRSLDLTGAFTYQRTSTNWDSLSEETRVSGLDSLNRLIFSAGLAYGFAPDWSVFFDLNWARTEITHTTLSGNAWGLGDQAAGLAYTLFRGGSGAKIDLQILSEIPLYSATGTNADPALGDASLNLSGGAFVTVPITESSERKVELIGGAAYQWRSREFSGAVPWSATARLTQIGKGFDGAVRLGGLVSLNTDPYTASLTQTLRNLSRSGGSLIFNATNPAFTAFGAEIGYRFGLSTRGYATFDTSIAGTGFARATTFAGGIQINLMPGVDSKPDLTRPKGEFVSYQGDATVTRVNDRFNLFKINKGTESSVRKGDLFDVFSVSTSGDVNEPIARAQVIEVRDGESALKVLEYYKEVWIEQGYLVKKPIR